VISNALLSLFRVFALNGKNGGKFKNEMHNSIDWRAFRRN
jgi:hypothetical protein